MCKCLNQAVAKKGGIALNVLLLLVLVPAIFFVGFDYRQNDLSWMEEGPYTPLAALKVTAVVFAFVSFLIGLFTFLMPKLKPLQILFIIFGGLSMLFSFSIAVYTLVASQIEDNSLTQSCKQDYKGMFHNFRYLDELFDKVDLHLCSYQCPCDFDNQTAVDEFTFSPKYKKAWEDLETNQEFKNFNNKQMKFYKRAQDCPNIDSAYLAMDGLFRTKVGKFNKDNFKKFSKYWGRIEEKFKCTGWCKRSSNNDRPFYKYLFSDVNNGVARNGCMNPFKNWQVKMLHAYGSLMIFVTFFQVLTWIFAINLLAVGEDSHIKNIHKETYTKQQ